MADFSWENKGSYADMSELAVNSMWPTSQAGGNMQSSAKEALTAPGSEPVDPVPDRSEQGDPHIDLAQPMPTGQDGKRRVSAGSRPSVSASWGQTTRPKIDRTGPTGATTS